MHKWNNKNSHTLTQLLNGKAWSWKPQLYVYNICHRYHAKILIQSLSQALSTIQSLHTNQAWSYKSMDRSLPAFSLPLLRNPCWRIALDEFKLPQPCSRSLYRHLYWVLDANHASLIVKTDSHTCPFTYLCTGLHWNWPCTIVNWCIL